MSQKLFTLSLEIWTVPNLARGRVAYYWSLQICSYDVNIFNNTILLFCAFLRMR